MAVGSDRPGADRAGAAVTCLARGGRPAPAGAALIEGDRDRADAHDALLGRSWDHVIDVSSNADHVGAAVTALGSDAARWTFISSVSAYSDDVAVDADESAPTHMPARPDDEYEYGPQKVAAENAVRVLGDRTLIVRPGLIVGPGDPSDRFGYWAAAFDRAADGRVLLPPTLGRSTQVIHVDDLAAFVATSTATGTVNAVGDRHPLVGVLDRIRTAAGHRGPTTIAEESWLVDRGVAFWMGSARCRCGSRRR